MCTSLSLYHSIFSYEQHQSRNWADDPRVWKALTSSRCLSMCQTAAAKLVSHAGGIAHAHAHTHIHTHTRAHTHVPWLDLIQSLNSACRDSRTGSILEQSVVWNCYPGAGLRSELWLTPANKYNCKMKSQNLPDGVRLSWCWRLHWSGLKLTFKPQEE